MAERERLITQQWDLVRDGQGNTVAVSERTPPAATTPVRGIDLAQMLTAMQEAQTRLGALQTMDALSFKTALAKTHNTLADLHNRTDTRLAAFVRNNLQTNQKLERIAKDQEANNALISELAHRVDKLTAALVKVVENDQRRRRVAVERKASGTLQRAWTWLSDERVQLWIALTTAVAMASFIVGWTWVRHHG